MTMVTLLPDGSGWMHTKWTDQNVTVTVYYSNGKVWNRQFTHAEFDIIAAFGSLPARKD